MARGWESKNIEAQQSEAAEAVRPRRSPLTPEQASDLREREVLQLSRTRVLQQIEVCTDSRYREMLEKSLAAIDRRLTELGAGN